MDRCRKLASFSEDDKSLRRTFLCPPMRDCHREIGRWMQAIGIEGNLDAAGNLRGLYPSDKPNAPRLLIGSHLDTVPNAGAYDGILGAVLSITLLEELRGRRLPFDIEAIGFSEEEGVRFGIPFIGSRALVGRLDRELLNASDANGITVQQALQDFGLNPSEIPRAQISSNAFAYLEFHIEQGPVLESLNLPLAAVESIAGQTRLEFTFMGRANHAGTTPMNLRHDALAGAGEWITAVESFAAMSAGLVATVGKIEALPGAANIIPAIVRASLDLRHSSDQVRHHSVEALKSQARDIASRRGLSVSCCILLDQAAVAMDPFLVKQTEMAIGKTQCQPHCMVSGAGHDAMILAEKVPAAMVFLRSPGGISHDPAESVAAGDVEKAIECGLHLLHQLASSPEFYGRINRA
jgi:allantoate deiminase